MEKNVDYVRLVGRAQLGDKQCLDTLARVAQERLRVDVYRLTLRHDLTQDIVQESILEMLKKLKELKEADRFWAWLYKIALNKMRFHHRKERRRRTVAMSVMGGGGVQDNGEDVMSNVIGRELKQIVFGAMQRLKPQHRAVLTMRCYREMEYSMIAESMGCSEFAARVLFCRAKKALKKQLSRQGLGRGSLLMALILFGKMTAPSEAAASQVALTAVATKVGVTAGLVATLTGKTAIVSLATAGILATGAVVGISGYDGKTTAYSKTAAQDLPTPEKVGHVGQVVEECWYYFPESTDGPVMIRAMISDSRGERSHFAWRQNEEANYYFDRRANIIYIENHRIWQKDLLVWRLPTDTAQLGEFVSKVEGRTERFEYVPTRGKGLLVITKRDSNGYRNHSKVVRDRHILDAEYFRYDWPAGVRVIDNRDAMHKRGWTYFTISGQVDGEEVLGAGRIPFVYAASGEHGAWLSLRLGNQRAAMDDGGAAVVRDGQGKVVGSYLGGSLFKGLGRPWMGLHTIDTIRRDAAEQQIWFETKYEPRHEKAEVVLTYEDRKMVYTIDMKADVIEKIALSKSNGSKAELWFDYLQDIQEVGDEFADPTVRKSYRTKRQESCGILWLLEIAFGEVVKR